MLYAIAMGHALADVWMFVRLKLELNELLYFHFIDAYRFLVTCILYVLLCVFCMWYVLPFGIIKNNNKKKNVVSNVLGIWLKLLYLHVQ